MEHALNLKVSEVYKELADEIQELYAAHGCPAHLQPGRCAATTDTPVAYIWDNIGDEAVAAELQGQLEDLLDQLGLNGLDYYYTTPEWCEFREAAAELIREYHKRYWVDIIDAYCAEA